MSGASMMLVALAIDALIGWPKLLYEAIGHPVTWMGRLIGFLDRHFGGDGIDDRARRMGGIATLVIVVGIAAEIAWLLTFLLPEGNLGIVLGGILAWPFIATRSLREHVSAVADDLDAGDMRSARVSVSRIVGRDPDQLDEAGISRAALESLAENSSDGIVAPVFWGVILGLPGIVAYKAINTLDSMIGHRTPRHEAFGWASAKLDDLVNIIPARLTGALYALLSGHPGVALTTMLRDARRHRSPNAGWPEAALAGGLGVRLSGPRSYADGISDEPWLNLGAPDPGPADLRRGLRLYGYVILALVALVAVSALA
ncbi:MAG: cobalamin biosynthesis protein CobD [Rhodobacteraceae bacterium]|nr:cobalamin biosynthesis protein CobD [Paracoccaceae bacterium]